MSHILDRRCFVAAQVMAALAPRYECSQFGANAVHARHRLAAEALAQADALLDLIDVEAMPLLGVPVANPAAEADDVPF